MVDTPFTSFAFPATGTGTVPRTTPNRLADVINVLEYGADPTYTNDSTTAIQNAFNAAFGTAGSPHGLNNAHLNKAVFIPNGHYAIWSGPLMLNQVYGGYIFGAGRQATFLDGGLSAGSDNPVLATNGMSNTRIETLRLSSGFGWQGHTGNILDLNWDGTNPAGAVGLHGNQFIDLLLQGGFCVKIARSGNDGANNSFIGCHINGGQVGIETIGASAVNQSVIGGNVGDCIVGLKATGGGFSHLAGISMQQQNVNGTDCIFGASSVGPTQMTGCRAEGDFFVVALSTSPITITACNQAGFGASPVFIEAHGPTTIEGCFSYKGKISVREGAQVLIQYTHFNQLIGVANWLDAPASGLWWVGDPGGHAYGATIELENVTSGDPMGSGNLVYRSRLKTTNGTSITTQTYQIV